MLPGLCDFKICEKWRCKADCVTAECTDTESVSRVKRLSLLCKAPWKMKESETPDSKTRFLSKKINHSSIRLKSETYHVFFEGSLKLDSSSPEKV